MRLASHAVVILPKALEIVCDFHHYIRIPYRFKKHAKCSLPVDKAHMIHITRKKLKQKKVGKSVTISI